MSRAPRHHLSALRPSPARFRAAARLVVAASLSALSAGGCAGSCDPAAATAPHRRAGLLDYSWGFANLSPFGVSEVRVYRGTELTLDDSQKLADVGGLQSTTSRLYDDHDQTPVPADVTVAWSDDAGPHTQAVHLAGRIADPVNFDGDVWLRYLGYGRWDAVPLTVAQAQGRAGLGLDSNGYPVDPPISDRPGQRVRDPWLTTYRLVEPGGVTIITPDRPKDWPQWNADPRALSRPASSCP